VRVPSEAVNGRAKVTVMLPGFDLFEFADRTMELDVAD
jgi:YesN/AraC family two-component response regulator